MTEEEAFEIPQGLVQDIAKGECVLFVGAGLSVGAGLPGWLDLMRQMLAWAEEHSVDLSGVKRELKRLIKEGDYLLVAEELRERMGDGRFEQFVTKIFRDDELRPTDTHRLLPQIPFAAVVTTNYDRLLERAYTSEDGGVPRSYTQEDTAELANLHRENKFYILKLHGDIDRIETVALGRSDYREAMFANPAYRDLLTTLFVSKTVFFVGASLAEPDVLRFLDGMGIAFKSYGRFHYALMPERAGGPIQRERFQRDYGIQIISYVATAGHPEVYEFLLELRVRVHETARVKQKRVPIEATREEEPPPIEAMRIEIATRALADKPSKVDLLGFEVYAKALADFIKNPNTKKPLTIGIDAAWGMGKTTLMHMIKDELAEQGEGGKRGHSFTTVWFDAWKYDQEESLWAALALEILAEVRRQSNIRQRVRFWWGLNRSRFEWKRLLQSFLKWVAYLLGIALLAVAVLWIASRLLGTTLQGTVQRFGEYMAILAGLGGVITVLYTASKDFLTHLIRPFHLGIAGYVREPDYEKRVGFLAQFEKDFAQLIDLVTDGGKWPLVVFIDDLDRCAPPKAAEIIEAINILLDAEHCVFVIGMDAQAVAGSIEASYKDLQAYLNDADDPGGLTLGQRFLEKIIQIDFRIPRADQEVIESFIHESLGALKGEPLPRPSRGEIEEAGQLIEAEQRAGKSLEEAAEAVELVRPNMSQRAVEEARQIVFAKSFDDSEDVQRAIYDAAPYLGLNPRKIKRFINIFRLQALIANRRGLLQATVIRLDLLAKSVIIAMRWPQMLEAMMSHWDFANRLREVHERRAMLRAMQSGESVHDLGEERTTQARLDVSLADPRMKRLIDATDLINLLDDMTNEDIEDLPHHLHLAEITAGRPKGPEA